MQHKEEEKRQGWGRGQDENVTDAVMKATEKKGTYRQSKSEGKR